MCFENPYYYPEKIGDPKYFYGRTQEVQAIHSILTQPAPAFISVIGERRIGKSSLLTCLPHLFERVGKQPLSDCLFVNADMQFIVGRTTRDFFDEVWKNFQIEKQTSTPAEAEINAKERFENQLKQLQEQGKRLVLLLDEFQIIAANAKFDACFFKFLTDMAEKYHVSYIVVSPKSLENYCHSDKIKNLPFVQRMEKLYIGSFTEEEAKQLIIEPAKSIKILLESEVDFVIDYAGYFPFFIQILCYHLVREAKDRPAALRQFRREAEPHMEYIKTVLDEQEFGVLQRLAYSENLEPSDTEVLKTLKRKGYLIRRGEQYRVFSRLLAEMI